MKKRGQTSTEFLIIIAIILVIIFIGASIVFDIPFLATNLKESSTSRRLETADIGILAYSFNSTNGTLVLKNNLDGLINLTIFLDSEEVYTGLLLNPKEQDKITFGHTSEILEYYNLDVLFEYHNLINSNNYGYSVTLEGETD